jgi:hypothetical protein
MRSFFFLLSFSILVLLLLVTVELNLHVLSFNGSALSSQRREVQMKISTDCSLASRSFEENEMILCFTPRVYSFYGEFQCRLVDRSGIDESDETIA